MAGFWAYETIFIVTREWVRGVGGETLDFQEGLGVENDHKDSLECRYDIKKHPQQAYMSK